MKGKTPAIKEEGEAVSFHREQLKAEAIAKGEVRVLTAHGFLEQTEGESRLGISPEGLRITLHAGEASLVSPYGAGPLTVGEPRLVR